VSPDNLEKGSARMTRLVDDWAAGYYRGKDDHPCDPGDNPFPPGTAAHAG
jgi:hypothetical protein